MFEAIDVGLNNVSVKLAEIKLPHEFNSKSKSPRNIFFIPNIILCKFALKGNNYFIRFFDLFNSNAGFAKSFFP